MADSDADGNVIVNSFDELYSAIDEQVRMAAAGLGAHSEPAFTFPTTSPGPDFTVNPLGRLRQRYERCAREGLLRKFERSSGVVNVF